MAHGIRPQPSYTRASWRAMYIECFHQLGSLYAADCEPEEQAIREACEELGVPMGYGRVGKPPEILTEDDLPMLFRWARKA